MKSPEIFIVEDDPAVREVMSIVLSAAGYRATCFADGAALLAAARKQYPLCIILDVNLPGKSGLEVLRELTSDDYPAPIFMMSGQGTIDIAMQAVRDGAADFIQKPFLGAEMVGRIEAALARENGLRASRFGASLSPNLPGAAALTGRERQILVQTLLGKSIKEIGRLFGLSPRTVEDHRSNIMRKTGAKNAIELFRVAIGTDTVDRLVTTVTQTNSE